jgi:BirA family biotin operon repressor/biotin-[acetyl-CoA-carboxylase] ligase
VHGKKIAGILVETGLGAVNWAVLGIGINVNQSEFHGTYRVEPTSLKRECAEAFDLEALLGILSKKLEQYYGLWISGGAATVIDAWAARSDMFGQPVLLHETEGTSTVTAVRLNEDGSLRVRNNDGTLRDVYAGDVSLSPH